MKKVFKYKISRRLGVPLFEKCQTQKFVLREARRAPKFRRGFFSEYNKQLLEKQKIRNLYSISETVLKNYVKSSILKKTIDNSVALNLMLECRLDSIVHSLGLCSTRRMARQLVSHGHFLVNGKKLKSSAYQVKQQDKISIRTGSQNTTLFKSILANKIKPKNKWVTWNGKEKYGYLSDETITGEDILNLSSVFEYYSR